MPKINLKPTVSIAIALLGLANHAYCFPSQITGKGLVEALHTSAKTLGINALHNPQVLALRAGSRVFDAKSTGEDIVAAKVMLELLTSKPDLDFIMREESPLSKDSASDKLIFPPQFLTHLSRNIKSPSDSTSDQDSPDLLNTIRHFWRSDEHREELSIHTKYVLDATNKVLSGFEYSALAPLFPDDIDANNVITVNIDRTKHRK